MISVNQRVRFDALEHINTTAAKLSAPVTGAVYDVNEAHQVFHVAYDLGGTVQRTSFKFTDIGNAVTICKN